MRKFLLIFDTCFHLQCVITASKNSTGVIKFMKEIFQTKRGIISWAVTPSSQENPSQVHLTHFYNYQVLWPFLNNFNWKFFLVKHSSKPQWMLGWVHKVWMLGWVLNTPLTWLIFSGISPCKIQYVSC